MVPVRQAGQQVTTTFWAMAAGHRGAEHQLLTDNTCLADDRSSSERVIELDGTKDDEHDSKPQKRDLSPSNDLIPTRVLPTHFLEGEDAN